MKWSGTIFKRLRTNRKQFLKRCQRLIYDLRPAFSQLKKEKPSHLAKPLGIRWLKWLLSLLFWNIGIKALDYLPFIHKERKCFAKEMRPILYFKTPRSFVIMGLNFSVIAPMLTNYVVALLRACFYYLYLMLQSKSLEVTFDQSGLAFSNLWWMASFSTAPILDAPLFLHGLGLILNSIGIITVMRKGMTTLRWNKKSKRNMSRIPIKHNLLREMGASCFP